MRTFVLVSAALVLAANPARSQDPAPAPAPAPAHAGHMMAAQAQPGRPFAWFFSLGGQSADYGDAETAFAGAGYSAPADQLFQIGGGLYGLRGRLLIGGEGYALMGDEVSSTGGRETKTLGAAGFFNLGYLVVDRPIVRAYPLLGLGGVHLSYRIQEAGAVGLGPNVANPSFAQVLQSPGQRSVLSSAGFALSLGGGVDVTPVMRRRANGSTYGLLLGVRAGYQWTPVRDDWRLYDIAVTGGPDDLLDGFFFRVSIGGSGRHVRRGCPMMHGGDGGDQNHACPMHDSH